MTPQSILGRERPYDEVPYFWSDQFGLRLQHVGHADAPAGAEIEADAAGFTARYRDEDGRLLAALAANRPREIAAMRRELAGEPAGAAAARGYVDRGKQAMDAQRRRRPPGPR